MICLRPLLRVLDALFFCVVVVNNPFNRLLRLAAIYRESSLESSGQSRLIPLHLSRLVQGPLLRRRLSLILKPYFMKCK